MRFPLLQAGVWTDDFDKQVLDERVEVSWPSWKGNQSWSQGRVSENDQPQRQVGTYDTR